MTDEELNTAIQYEVKYCKAHQREKMGLGEMNYGGYIAYWTDGKKMIAQNTETAIEDEAVEILYALVRKYEEQRACNNRLRYSELYALYRKEQGRNQLLRDHFDDCWDNERIDGKYRMKPTCHFDFDFNSDDVNRYTEDMTDWYYE